MRTESILNILDTSLFMKFDHAPRQQHTLAAVEYEAAEAALLRAMSEAGSKEEDDDVLASARDRWLAATANLRDATIDYMLSLRDGVEQTTTHLSLDEFLENCLMSEDDEVNLDDTE